LTPSIVNTDFIKCIYIKSIQVQLNFRNVIPSAGSQKLNVSYCDSPLEGTALFWAKMHITDCKDRASC